MNPGPEYFPGVNIFHWSSVRFGVELCVHLAHFFLCKYSPGKRWLWWHWVRWTQEEMRQHWSNAKYLSVSQLCKWIFTKDILDLLFHRQLLSNSYTGHPTNPARFIFLRLRLLFLFRTFVNLARQRSDFGIFLVPLPILRPPSCFIKNKVAAPLR